MEPQTLEPLDLDAVRGQFPALADGRIFFDNPGGSQVPRSVIDAIAAYLERDNANLGGAYATSRASDRLLDETRLAVADLFNAARPDEIVFGANMTSLTLSLSRSLGRELVAGDEIVLTRLDHDANITPWLRMAEERDAVVRWVDFSPRDGTLDLDQLAAVLSPKTRLVAVTMASNALGTVTPAREIVELAHEAGALCFVDAVQYAPHRTIDVAELGCDFLAASAYKFFGPHVGMLYGKLDHLDRLHAYQVRPASQVPPGKFEIGTLNHEGIAGVLAAVEYLANLSSSPETPRRQRLVESFARIGDHEAALCRRLIELLEAVPGARIYGLTDPARGEERVPTVSFTLRDHHPREVARFLGEAGIYVWDGNYYALEVTRALGLEDSGGMVRAGLVHYNTLAELDKLEAVLATL